MDYERIYREFIFDRQEKNLFIEGLRIPGREFHHIVPRSLGGSDDSGNIVCLKYSDHLFAHLLLAKIYGGKLNIAFLLMLDNREKYTRRSRLEYARRREEAHKFYGKHRVGQLAHPNQLEAFRRKGEDRTEKQLAHNRALNEAKRGKTMPEHVKEALRKGNENRNSQARIEGYIRGAEKRRGRKAHPNSIEAASRRGEARSQAQRDRDFKVLEKARSCITEESHYKMGAGNRGKPWSEARLAAHKPKYKKIDLDDLIL